MNRIDTLFSNDPKGLLSIYFCAGTPLPDGTADVIRTLEKEGVSMIEIGIPFSDPMADGPVIQDAATKALKGGMTLEKLFSQLEGIREDVKIPLVLMGYLNPIFRYGFEPFCRRCAEVGIDGVIIPDLPFRDYMENSKFGPISNVDQWFKTIRIDFPVDPFDEKCTFFHQKIYYFSPSMGQKDTNKDDTSKAVSK